MTNLFYDIATTIGAIFFIFALIWYIGKKYKVVQTIKGIVKW